MKKVHGLIFHLPVDDEDVATLDKIKDWKYLERIADKIIQGKEISVAILIDGSCSKALELLKVIPLLVHGLSIGEWTPSTSVACNRVSVQDMTTKTVTSHYFDMQTEVKGVGIEQMLHRLYAAHFNEHCSHIKEKLSMRCQ